MDLVEQSDVEPEDDDVLSLELNCMLTSINKYVPRGLINCIEFNTISFRQHKALLRLDLVNLSFRLGSLKKHLLPLVLVVCKLGLEGHFECYSICKDKQRKSFTKHLRNKLKSIPWNLNE